MVSFNLVFHVASALACVLLIYALLRLQSLVRFHGRLWQSLDPARTLVQLDWPTLFLQKFGRALDVPVEGGPDKGQPSRIQMGPWVAAHLELRFTRIVWKTPQELLIETLRQDMAEVWSSRLEAALGGMIRVQLQSSAGKLKEGV